MALPAPKEHLKVVTAGWRYRNGAGHFAYDYAMPIGTPLYAVQDGVILDCNDGVKDQPRGVPAGRGAPSNFIVLGFTHQGKKASAFYQHLTRGLRVREGQKVKAGQLIGFSGNSGNTTGPHLHLATGFGHWADGDRYPYMANGGENSVVIFAPTKVYPPPAKPITTLSRTTKMGENGWQVPDLRWVLVAAGFLSREFLPGNVRNPRGYDRNVQAAVKRFHQSPAGARYRGGDPRQVGPMGWRKLQRLAGRG